MMYGATGSLDLGEVYKATLTGQINKQVLSFGLVFIVSGLAFKLGVVPFHMWVPDVYQGAPTAATMMVAGAPKLAAFAITIRLLVEGLINTATDWQQMLMVLAVASMALGNLAAIAQTNLKRMLAYSGIAQLGFMLLGFVPSVVAGNTVSAGNGYDSALFYVLTYVLTTLGTFGMIMFLSRPGFEAEQISDLSGLSKRSPQMAAVMAIFMFSLAGLPPTVGFYAKLAVLQSLITTNSPLHLQLAIAAVMLSLVGAFYYLRIVKVMYFDEPTDTAPVTVSGEARALLSVNALAVLGLGILPGGLMALCTRAIIQSLAG
jgi:NADH-quinone oxidoreductase subunit N